MTLDDLELLYFGILRYFAC